MYFKNIEKWALLPIAEETKDSELAFWIYRCLGTLILCISPMLYTKVCNLIITKIHIF